MEQKKKEKVQLLLIFMQIQKHHMRLGLGEELLRRGVCSDKTSLPCGFGL